MKRKIITFIMLLIAISTQGQHLHVIRFIHGGDEGKPIGTIIISVEGVVPFTDKPFDSTFGQSIKTNIKTFKIIRKLIKEEKYKTQHPTELDNRDFLRIVDSDGFLFYLVSSKYKSFFDDLRSVLIKKRGDEAVISLFKQYY